MSEQQAETKPTDAPVDRVIFQLIEPRHPVSACFVSNDGGPVFSIGVTFWAVTKDGIVGLVPWHSPSLWRIDDIIKTGYRFIDYVYADPKKYLASVKLKTESEGRQGG